MVRIHVDASSTNPGPPGVVERLGTGRKRGFSGGDELLRLIAGWSHAPPKMRPPGGRGNEYAEDAPPGPRTLLAPPPGEAAVQQPAGVIP